MPDLDSLLKPRSVAVIGASTQPDKVGGMPIRLLRELGYAGRIYPVHPSAGEIQGLPAYPSMAAIGEPVDLAIVAVPAVATESVMAQLGTERYARRDLLYLGLCRSGRGRPGHAAGAGRQRAGTAWHCWAPIAWVR
ncbi:CoA-binding protein [Cupriavidus basilensis]